MKSKLDAPFLVCAFVLIVLAPARHSDADDGMDFLRRNCVKCHGAESPEAGLRLDVLSEPDPDDDEVLSETWSLIAERLRKGDMPPETEPRPDPRMLQRLIDRLDVILPRSTNSLPALRRMNRAEYEATVHDLLGIDVPLQQYLPEDGETQGFDNVSGGLGISSILMERYLEAADAAFEATIRRIRPLPPQKRRVVLMENKDNVASVEKRKGGVTEVSGAFVDPSPRWPAPRMDEVRPIEDGVYRCRVALWPHQPSERTLAAALFVGPMFTTGSRRRVGVYDVTGTPDNPRVIEFTTFMNAGDTIHVLPWIYPDHVSWRDKHEPMPGVGLVWAETFGPLDQAFPSESQQRLFGNSATLSMGQGPSVYNRHRRKLFAHVVESAAPREDANRIIRTLVPRAFRRPVEQELVDQFVQLTLDQIDSGHSFEQAVRAGVTATLCSPHFLLLNREPRVDDFTIASRLSYFLWGSMPDDELLRLAAAGKLSDPSVRFDQVERMLKDEKSERFIDNFIGQWLDLRDIAFTTPDARLYPEYDDLLLHSMLGETRGFFKHLLEHDLSVTEFVDSDFTVLNQRLAAHYGVEGVVGHEDFRIVRLPDDSVRGGLLTQASVLKVTANGTNTSPVLRGVWVLQNLLGQSVPPPPPGVPAVEPDIRGATTIREQLARHSDDGSCVHCHVRIDPPGFALEEFDAIGQYRDHYRSLGGDGQRGPRRAAYRIGPAVETGGIMADGRVFDHFVEFRRILLEDPEAIASALASKLLVYGSGRPMTPADRGSIDSVVNQTKKTKFGLRSMVHAVVETELFLRP